MDLSSLALLGKGNWGSGFIVRTNHSNQSEVFPAVKESSFFSGVTYVLQALKRWPDSKEAHGSGSLLIHRKDIPVQTAFLTMAPPVSPENRAHK